MTWFLLFACASQPTPSPAPAAAPAPAEPAPARMHQFVVAPDGIVVGLGGSVYDDAGTVRFHRPRTGYPLEGAGVIGGEALRAVNDVRIESLEQAQQLLTGEAGTALRLVVAAPGAAPSEKTVFLTQLPDLSCYSLEVPYTPATPRVRYEAQPPADAVKVVCPTGESWTPASVEADAR